VCVYQHGTMVLKMPPSNLNADSVLLWRFMIIFKCLLKYTLIPRPRLWTGFPSQPIWILLGWQRGKGSFTKLIHSTIRGIATLYPVTFPAVSLYSHTPRVCQFYWSATLYHSVLVRFHSQQISPLSGFLGISLSSDCIMKLW